MAIVFRAREHCGIRVARGVTGTCQPGAACTQGPPAVAAPGIKGPTATLGVSRATVYRVLADQNDKAD